MFFFQRCDNAEKSHRRTSTTARRDYASHVDGWNRVPLDKGNGAGNLSDERQTVGATIQRNDVPRGTMDETSSLWTLVSIALPRSVREVRLFRLFLLIPCWESQRLIPKRSAGPRATKIGVVSLKALDHHRPNREKSAALPLNYPPPPLTTDKVLEDLKGTRRAIPCKTQQIPCSA